MRGRGRRILGALLVFVGVLLVWMCLPLEFFLLALGVAMTAAGLWILDC